MAFELSGSVIIDDNRNVVSGAAATFTGEVTIPTWLVHAGDTDTKYGFPDADTFAVETAGDERLRILSDGAVGINETSPTGKLTITQDPQGFPSDSAQPNATLLIKHGTSGSNRRWVGIGASLTGAWIQSSSPGGDGLAAPLNINPGGGDVLIPNKLIHYGDTDTFLEFGTNTVSVETAGTEAIRVDSSQRLLVGHTASDDRDGYQTSLQVSGTGGNDSSVSLGRWSDDQGGAGLILSKSRDGTIGDHTVVIADDYLGSIQFQGDDGTNYHVGAQIHAIVQSGVGNDDMPADLIFATNSGTTTPTERLRITGIGSVGINNTSPATIVDIKSAKASDGLTITKGSNVAAFLGHNGTGDEGLLHLKDGGVLTTQIYGETGQVSFLNAGNVGIGTNNPQRKLVVSDDGTEGFEFYPGDSANGGSLNLYNRATAGWIPLTINSQDFRWAPSGGTEAFRIASSGKVGIGTITPNATLDIYGANSNAMLRLTESNYTNTNKYTKIFEYGGNTYFSTRNDTNAGSFIFRGETASTTPEFLRIDQSGRLLVGHTATVDTSTYNSKIQVMDTDAEASITVGRFSNDGSATALNLSKSRATDIGSHTDGELHDDDVIGNIFWWGSDGSDYEEAARISVNAGAAFTSGGTPGELTFWTTASDATAATERLRIDSSGRLLLGTQKTYGDSGYYDDITINNSNGSAATGGTGINLISSTDSWGSILFGHSGDNNIGAIKYDHTTDSMRFVVNTIDPALLINSSGKIGIGTVSPDFQLHSFEDDGSSIAGLFETNQTDSYISFQASGTTASSTVRIGANGDDLTTFVNGAERLRITSAGKIQVKGTRGGDLQPEDDDTLQIYTKSNDETANRGSGITFYNHAGTGGYEMGGTIQVAKENGGDNNVSSYMRFSTRANGGAALERLRIRSNGHIGIGDDITNDTAFLKVIAADGVADDQYAMQLHNEEATDGRSWGLSIRAGSNSTDYGLVVADHDNANKQFVVRGDGKVGIGTVNPGTKLHVLSTGNANTVLKLEPGTTAGNYGGIELGRTDGSGNIRMTTVVKGGVPISGISGIVFGSTNTNVPAVAIESANTAGGHIAFKPKGSEALRIHADGNVGIGSDDPDYKLVVAGVLKVYGSDGNAYGPRINPNSTGGTYEALIGSSNGDLRLQAGSGAYQADRANILLNNSNNDVLINSGTTSGGNVGIGTNAPYSNASYNSLSIGGLKKGLIELNDNSDVARAHLYTDGGDFKTSTVGTAGTIRFITGGTPTERLSITAAGRVDIGEATDVDHTLCVADSSTQTDLTASCAVGIQLQNKSTTDNTYSSIEWRTQSGGRMARIVGVQEDADGNGSHLAFLTEPSGGGIVERLRIGPSGQLGIGGANYGTDGQVLTSTGSGSAPAWEDASGGGGGGGSSVWVSNDTGIHTTSNVGIATTTASAVLEIGSTGVTTATTVINAQAWDGQVFNVDGNITSDSIFAVNDISGLPVIDFNATHGQLSLGAFGGNVSIGYTNAGTKLGLKGSTSERVHVSTGSSLSNVVNDQINIDNGNVHYYSVPETGGDLTAVDITSNNGLNNDMAVGDSVTVVVIIRPDSSSDKITGIEIDGSAVTEEWLGGEAPNGGASNTYDVYTFFILKTADATFLPLCNKVNFA